MQHWPFTSTSSLSLSLDDRQQSEEPTSLPRCLLPHLLLILVSNILPRKLYYCPSSLSPCGLNRYLSLWIFTSKTVDCRLLGYTTTIERHPTMAMIPCSDGCNLCLGTKEEHLWKQLPADMKSSVPISGFCSFPLSSCSTIYNVIKD